MEETAGSLALAVPYQYGQFVSPRHCSRSCVARPFQREPHKNATSRTRFRIRLCKNGRCYTFESANNGGGAGVFVDTKIYQSENWNLRIDGNANSGSVFLEMSNGWSGKHTLLVLPTPRWLFPPGVLVVIVTELDHTVVRSLLAIPRHSIPLGWWQVIQPPHSCSQSSATAHAKAAMRSKWALADFTQAFGRAHAVSSTGFPGSWRAPFRALQDKHSV